MRSDRTDCAARTAPPVPGMNCATPCAPARLTARLAEPAFLPDQPGEESGGRPVSCAAAVERVADLLHRHVELRGQFRRERRNDVRQRKRAQHQVRLVARLSRVCSRSPSMVGTATRSDFAACAGDTAYCQENSNTSRNLVPGLFTMAGMVGNGDKNGTQQQSHARKSPLRAGEIVSLPRAITRDSIEVSPRTRPDLLKERAAFANRMRQGGGNMAIQELRRLLADR